MFYVGPNGPIIEKDPEIQKLRESVMSRINDIAQDETFFVPDPNAIIFVSFEDALKELAAMKNS